MDWDDVRQPQAGQVIVGENLERLSVGELAARVAALKAEIERVEGELERKRAHEAQAAALFKTDDT
jgi:uncharacterized small protein (DUF1192 family)